MTAAIDARTASYYSRRLIKPDGRALVLYATHPIDVDIEATAPRGALVASANPHLRWHPLRGEWVAYAAHRQDRTFLPPASYNPLAPTDDADNPTEVPRGRYDIAVFENRFPSLFRGAHDPPLEIVPTLPGRGTCEVVVFTQDARSSLGALPVDHLALLIDVWAERYEELGRRDDVAYVMPFENRGVEVGVTLTHPHGQIYAYPFVPPVAATELAQERAYFERTGRGLLADHLESEIRDGRRILYAGASAVALVPVCARYAYECWVAPLRGAPSLSALTSVERRDFACALKLVLQKLDALWSRPMPYIFVLHQSPTDGELHPEAHVHAEIYPMYRMPGRLKYLAGSEIGAGVFTADTLPEEKAAELRAVRIE